MTLPSKGALDLFVEAIEPPLSRATSLIAFAQLNDDHEFVELEGPRDSGSPQGIHVVTFRATAVHEPDLLLELLAFRAPLILSFSLLHSKTRRKSEGRILMHGASTPLGGSEWSSRMTRQ